MRILLLLALALTSLVPSWSATPDPVIGTRTVTPKVTTVFTSGSVPFVSTNGILYQDNAKFFWDDTNFRLGIGNASPSTALDVTGTGKFSGAVTLSAGATSLGNILMSGPGTYLYWTNSTQLRSLSDGNLRFEMQSGTDLLTMTLAPTSVTLQPSGQFLVLGASACATLDKTNVRLGIGTATPATTIDAVSTTEQLRLSYDATHYASHSIDATGSENISTTAGWVSVGATNYNIAGYSSTRRGVTVSGTASHGVVEVASGAADADATVLGTVEFNFPASTGAGGKEFVGLIGRAAGSTALNRGGQLEFYTKADAGSYTRRATVDNAGNFGVGTGATAITARLESTSTTEQLRLNYDATHYAGMTVNSSGNLTIAQGTSGAVKWLNGTGSPESSVTASVGSLYTRTDGGAGTTLYVKESGTGNTGWVGK